VHLFDKIIKISVSIPLVVVVMGEVGEILGFGDSVDCSVYLEMSRFKRVGVGW
jgi:hypothetical protein